MTSIEQQRQLIGVSSLCEIDLKAFLTFVDKIMSTETSISVPLTPALYTCYLK
jgi:hypothetical protein